MAADGDWQDFYEFQEPARSVQDQENCNASPEAEAGAPAGGDSFPALACSLEEKLSLCFRPSKDAEPPRTTVRPITERSLLQGDEIWNALTDNYGNVMPVDWKSSRTRALHLLTLNLSEKGCQSITVVMLVTSKDFPFNTGTDVEGFAWEDSMSDGLLFDTSDEEELREQLDMHSIIVSCVNEEPLFTADQVIEEIEEMMQESPDPEDDETPTQSDRLSMLSQEIQTLKRSSMSSYEERVKRLSVSELNELLEEIETAIKEYSEELVQQLALRDELEFEKEVENSFISALIEVQNKQKEHKETAKKKKKLKNGSSQNGRNERSHMPGTPGVPSRPLRPVIRARARTPPLRPSSSSPSPSSAARRTEPAPAAGHPGSGPDTASALRPGIGDTRSDVSPGRHRATRASLGAPWGRDGCTSGC
ncbi:Fasciculation and elongation protein zeta-2 [Microtus ochrogaster]|uniref:Fasciculation and elongation protein zeta-2 n=1 Tax=Microtus ochrogaster TaxID=79684 RepID=A0A8J6KSJ6_MICOH|nr:Fasciculation and elongation protein zeta-2 [Microtus ochrogaster]